MNTCGYMLYPTLLALCGSASAQPPAALPVGGGANAAQSPIYTVVEVDEVSATREMGMRPRPTPRSAAADLVDLFPAQRELLLPELGPEDVVRVGDTNLVGIGRVDELLVDSDVDGIWSILPDGAMLWTLAVKSPNAAGLRLRFEPFRPVAGSEVIVYNAANPAESHGPYRSVDARNGQPFWTPTLYGSQIRVEWYVPADVITRGPLGSLNITGAAQIFPHPSADERGGCRLDVTCHPEWQTTAQSVGQFSFVSDCIGGPGLDVCICSGAMVNRIPSDLCPLFLTAAHCIGNDTEAASIDITWFFQTSSCNGSVPDPATLPHTTWSIIVARDADSDICLLGLAADQIPNGVVWAGWTNVEAPDPTPATLIHHPLGMRKSWSPGTLLGIEDFTQCAGLTSETYDFELSTGGQDGGSSGAPVFDDSHHRIRAVATCSESDNCIPAEDTGEGAFSYGYSTVSEYLETRDDVWVNGAWVLGENGSQSFPWDSLVEGFYGVHAAGRIHIVAGSYGAPFSFVGTRGMTLVAEGGTVRIGD